MNTLELATHIVQTLDDNKAKDIIALDVRSLTSITDYMVICTAGSSRQTNALIDKVLRACRALEMRPLNLLDEKATDWQVLDFGDVVVHVMIAEAREFYQLEKLWDQTQALRKEAS